MRILLSAFAALMLAAGLAAPVAAEVALGPKLCHAVAARTAAPGSTPPPFACTGAPSGYQGGSLWLRSDLDQAGIAPRDLVLLIHNSRFDRLEVSFTYADGRTVRRHVRGGAFGMHWRAGGQIAFEAPLRDARLTTITMRFDRMASINLLRARLVTRGEAALQATALSASIAAALTLLLIGMIYNGSLALSLRRQFPGWQAAWAGCMLAWGTIWSQLHLFVFPAMAGAVSAQMGTALACLAITLAAFSAVTALDPATVPRSARRLTLGLAVTVGVLGIPLTMMRRGPIDAMGQLLGVLVLAVLCGVTLCLAWAWRRGNPEARAFAGAWSLPMIALGGSQLVDTDDLLWGGGSQLLVLFAAAWQTLWLAAAASRTHARLRIENDRARRAEADAHELARRDPLTGLRNRRGFIETVEPMLELVRTAGGPVALMLLDVDMFKQINDSHGHDAGDTVLVTIARRIERWEGALCTVARLGGEEFALMVAGMEGFALARFAESVRLGVSACDHRSTIGDRRVTASIGVAQASRHCDFRQLYRQADEALYTAKRQGRDRVVICDGQELLWAADHRPRTQALH